MYAIKNKSLSRVSFVLYIIVLSMLEILSRERRTNALPITSRPIENTAENLAWQAWLMLPPEQKSLEKSRKVTPKSIFTLPFRDCPLGYKQLELPCKNDCVPGQLVQMRCVSECPPGYKEQNSRCILDCPPGHKVFEFNCISLFSIDQDKLLAQELGLLAGNTENSYDYEDDEMLLYDPPQKLSGEFGLSIADTYDSESQLPSQDEPLKFNIFEQKFPTDYVEESDSNPLKDELADLNANNQTDYEDVVSMITNGTSELEKGNETLGNASMVLDFSERGGLNPMVLNVSSVNLVNKTEIKEPFSLENLDALAFPASSVTTVLNEPQKISLFKDENSVQLVTSSLLSNPSKEEVKDYKTDLPDLLMRDDLLPLNNKSMETAILNSTVDGLQQESSNIDAVSDVTPQVSLAGSEDSFTAVASMTVEDVSTVKSQSEVNDKVLDKNEFPRSINSPLNEKDSEPQEYKFSTTLEPESTTNYQVDETTIIETYDLPTIVLHELEAKHPLSNIKNKNSKEGETHLVLKKSKVEPVDDEVLTQDLKKSPLSLASPSPSSAVATSTAATTDSTMSTASEENTMTNLQTPLPSVLNKLEQNDNDRFNYQQSHTFVTETINGQEKQQESKNILIADTATETKSETVYDRRSIKNDFSGSTAAAILNQPVSASESGSVSVFESTMETTKPGYEFDFEQELRLINALVKGKRKTTSSTSISASTESSFTTNISQDDITETFVNNREAETSPSSSTFTVQEQKEATKSASSQLSLNNIASTLYTAATTTSSSTTEAAIVSTTIASLLPLEEDSTSKTSPTMTTTSSQEATISLWEKFLPILGFGSSTASSKEPPTTVSAFPNTEIWSSSKKPLSSSTSNTINSNRSNRNSKITRTNLNFPTTVSSHAFASTPSPSILPSQTTSPSPLPFPSQDSSTSSTKETPTSASSQTETSNDENSIENRTTEASDDNFEPFWWLPIGWRLDRNASPEDKHQQPQQSNQQKEQQPFLFRFWSIFPSEKDLSSSQSTTATPSATNKSS